MSNSSPLRWLEVYGFFRRNVGPRSESAGVRVQFPYNEAPGIHYKVAVRDEYRTAILQGLNDGMTVRFTDFAASASIWITGVDEHPIDSSRWAFYLAARCAIEQAYTLTQLKLSDFEGQTSRIES